MLETFFLKIIQDLGCQDRQVKFFPVAYTLVVLLNTGQENNFRADCSNQKAPSLRLGSPAAIRKLEREASAYLSNIQRVWVVAPRTKCYLGSYLML